MCKDFMICVQVPEQVFVTDKLPKTATGKIQRRHMVAAFIEKGSGQKNASQDASKEGSKSGDQNSGKPPSTSQPRSKL